MGLQPGAVIGPNLRLRKLLAVGGMGSVWEADHLRLKTRVAVKFIADVLLSEANAQRRFALEAEAAAQIRSPHVVQMLDHGSTDQGVPYIVMELLEGESLGACLQRRGRLELDETAVIVHQTSKALRRAHELGFVHRDIKPDNLFLTDSNGELFVKILDFGIAKRQGEPMSMTRSGAALGTPRYMSPEQLANAKHVTPAADLWSLAAVAYRALMGKAPFDGETVAAIWAAIGRTTFPLPSRIRVDLPASLDIWFRRALNVDVVNRISSAREFSETFARAAQLHPGIAVQARLPVRDGPPANDGVPSDAPAPNLRSVATETVLRRRECIHFVPRKNDAPPPRSAPGFTHDDSDGVDKEPSESHGETWGYEREEEFRRR
jgi:serine/threonine-protein kinase